MRIQQAGERDFQEPRFVRLEHGSIWLHFEAKMVAKLWQVFVGSW